VFAVLYFEEEFWPQYSLPSLHSCVTSLDDSRGDINLNEISNATVEGAAGNSDKEVISWLRIQLAESEKVGNSDKEVISSLRIQLAESEKALSLRAAAAPEPACDEANLDDMIFMMITGGATRERAVNSKRTWLTHIDPQNVVIVSDTEDNNLNAFVVPDTSGGHGPSQGKWIPGLKRIWQLHNDRNKKYKWFAVGDDDTYFFLRHAAKFLHDKDPKVPKLYAQRCSNYHFCGGAGWIASLGLVEKWFPRLDECNRFPGQSDEKLARCLAGLGMWDGVFLDSKEFASGKPASYLFQAEYQRDKPGDNLGFAVTFHYVKDEDTRNFWALDTFLLHFYRRQSCIESGINPRFQLTRAP